MKNLRIVLTALLVGCFMVSVNAQTEKGKILLGGDSKLSFSTMSSKWKSDNGSGDEGKATSFDFAPRVGYFVANGLAVGVEIPFNYTTNKDEDDDKFTMSTFIIMPFARYYFGSGNIKPYLHGGVGGGSAKYKDEPKVGASRTSTVKVFSFEFGGGIGVFLNDKVSLDLGLGYSSMSMKNKENNTNNYKSTTSGVALSVGFVVTL